MKHGIDSATQKFAPPPRVSGFRLRPTALSLALAGLFAPSGPALAAIINVGGTCSLANAINAANNDAVAGGCSAGSGADTVVLPTSTTITLNAALPSISSNVTVQGNGTTVTRSLNAVSFPIFNISSSSASVTMSDITVTGGAPAEFGSNAGGISSRGTLALDRCSISGNSGRTIEAVAYGTLVITNCTISGNSGSGIHIETGSRATIESSTIDNNSGSGIYLRPFATLAVENSTVSSNTSELFGGGIHSRGALSLSNVIVSGNTGNRGGGIYSQGVTEIRGGTISGNTANGDGGGIYIRSGSSSRTTIVASSVLDNHSSARGGAVFSAGVLTLERSIVSGNSAQEGGGGLYCLGKAIVTNSTISSNRTAGDGGGIADLTNIEVSDSTVSNNIAEGSGGGIFSDDDTISLRRSMVSGNSAPTGAEVGFESAVTITADEFNLLGHGGLTNAQAFSGFIPDVADRTATSDGTNPKVLGGILCPLALNAPGTTQTHLLPSGSPAINAGGTTCSATDQRGIARPLGAACDAGAVETNGSACPSAITIANASITEGNTGTVNLSFKVRLSAPAPAAVRVNFATQDRTARQPGDYVAKTGTLNIAKGKSSGDIVIQVKGDTAIERNETFKVLLSNPRGASITTGTATGTIKNDDRPRLSINDVRLTEGNSGQKNATFTVRLSPAPTGPVTVKFATADGTAKKPSDYVAKSGTVSFAAGQTSKTVLIPVKGDRSKEANETFRVNLSAATGASIADGQGLGTITNDD